MFNAYFGMFKNFAQVYSFLFIANVLISAFIILFDNKKPISTLLWVMAINFLPVIGFILYLFIGQDISKSRIFDGKNRADMILEKDSEYQLKQLKEGSFEYSNDRTRAHLDMVEMFNRAEDEILYTNNRVKVYNEGESKFKDLFDDLRQAKHTIYAVSYTHLTLPTT